MSTLISILSDIADAIRNRGTSGQMLPSQMSAKVQSVDSGSKYGMSMDTIMGEVDENGELQYVSPVAFYSNQIKEIPAGLFENAFWYRYWAISELNLPELTTVGDSGMSGMFSGEGLSDMNVPSTITSVSLPKLTTVGANGLYRMLYNNTSIQTIDLSGLVQIIDGTLSTSTGPLNQICYASSVQSVDLSKLTTIGSYGLSNAFNRARQLTNINLSSLTTIGSNGLRDAFQYTDSLKYIDLSKVTDATGMNGAFQYSGVEIVDLTSLQSAPAGLGSLFRYCSSLKWVDFSSLSTIASGITYLFGNCTSLKFGDLSNVETVSLLNGLNYTFNNDTALEYADLQNLTGLTASIGNILNSIFSGCTSLKKVKFTKLNKVAAETATGMVNAFNGCTALQAIDMSEATAIPAIAATAFTSTNSTFQVIVPDSLLTDWKAATNWSSISSQIVGASSYFPYDHKVEWIQPSTTTLVINTGVQANQVSRFVIKYQVNSWTQYGYVFKAYTNETTNSCRIIQASTSSSNEGLVYINTKASGGSLKVPMALNTWYTVTAWNYDGKLNARQGGTKYSTNVVSGTAMANSVVIQLFGNAKPKIAKFQAFDSTGKLLIDLIPVRKNGAGYMYNWLTNTLMANSGSGTFSYGSDV